MVENEREGIWGIQYAKGLALIVQDGKAYFYPDRGDSALFMKVRDFYDGLYLAKPVAEVQQQLLGQDLQEQMEEGMDYMQEEEQEHTDEAMEQEEEQHMQHTMEQTDKAIQQEEEQHMQHTMEQTDEAIQQEEEQHMQHTMEQTDEAMEQVLQHELLLDGPHQKDREEESTYFNIFLFEQEQERLETLALKQKNYQEKRTTLMQEHQHQTMIIQQHIDSLYEQKMRMREKQRALQDIKIATISLFENYTGILSQDQYAQDILRFKSEQDTLAEKMRVVMLEYDTQKAKLCATSDQYKLELDKITQAELELQEEDNLQLQLFAMLKADAT